MTGGLTLVDLLGSLALVLGLIVLSGAALRIIRQRSGLIGAVSELKLRGAMPVDTKHRMVILSDGHADYTVILGGNQPLLLATRALPGAGAEQTPAETER